MSALGNLAQVYNSYIWPDKDAPRYLTGFVVCAILLAVGAAVYTDGSLGYKRSHLKAQE